ncbi:MAG: PD-(D/E)XK nuclease family protein [Patescibacteria group bacterium]
MAHGIPQTPEDAWTKFNATKVISLMTCLRRALLDHITPVDAPINPFAAHGIALHGVFQRFFTRDKSTRRFPFLEKKKLIGAWLGQWLGALKGEHGFGGRGKKHPAQVVAWESDEEREHLAKVLLKKGITASSIFYDRFHEVRQDGHHRRMEAGFNLPWANRLTLTGRIDRIDKDPDGAIVVDYKSGRYPPHLLVSGLQMTFYQLAYERFFRRHHTWRVPLKALHIYDYKSGQTQSAPLRPAEEFGNLLEVLTESQVALKVTLTNERPRNWRAVTFERYNKRDVERGEMSPYLPRGDHCSFCRHLAACLSWQERKEPTARQLFADYWRRPRPPLFIQSGADLSSDARRHGTELGQALVDTNRTIQLDLDLTR